MAGGGGEHSNPFQTKPFYLICQKYRYKIPNANVSLIEERSQLSGMLKLRLTRALRKKPTCRPYRIRQNGKHQKPHIRQNLTFPILYVLSVLCCSDISPELVFVIIL
jgi:hypothetical protein